MIGEPELESRRQILVSNPPGDGAIERTRDEF